MALVKNPVMDSPISGIQGNLSFNSPSSPAYLPGYLLGGRASPPLGSHGKQYTPGQSQLSQSPFASPRLLFADKKMHSTNSQKVSPMMRQGQRDKQNAPPVEGLYDESLPSKLDGSPWASTRLVPQSPFKQISTIADTPAPSYMETSPCSSGFNPRPDAFPQSPAQLDPFYTQGESLKTTDILDDTWITVFGFPPVAASYILQQFSQYGTITQHEIPNDGNWMHIQYQTKLQAKKALSKNGKIFSGKIMIGVRPCIEKELIAGGRSAMTPASPMTPRTSQLSSPAIATRTGTIRPLTAAYKAASDNLQVVQDGKGTPQRNNSVVSKAMEYVFGW